MDLNQLVLDQMVTCYNLIRSSLEVGVYDQIVDYSWMQIDIIDETPSILFMENRDIALELDETCDNKKYLL
jgi:hypothetical protein